LSSFLEEHSPLFGIVMPVPAIRSVLRNSAELHWDAQRGWNGLPRPWEGGR
jgi:hypothetical protein